MLVIQLPNSITEKIPGEVYQQVVERLAKTLVLLRLRPNLKASQIYANKILYPKKQDYVLLYEFDGDTVILDKNGKLIQTSEPCLVEVAEELFKEKYNIEYLHTSQNTVIDVFDIAIDKSPEIAELAQFLGQDELSRERQFFTRNM